MMERIFLAVLILSGWLLPSICLLRQYHYVTDLKTWSEAQRYCRQKHTDLATIENSEEMNQLANTVLSAGSTSDVWIGLYSNIHWRWSDGYEGTGADYRDWKTTENEPNFYNGTESCVDITDGAWWDYNCQYGAQFFCYRGTQLDPEFVFVNEKMSWSSAQRYCRENFRDLATVRNDTENQQIYSRLPGGARAWIGLFRDPHLYWSDQSNYSFSYLYPGEHPLGSATTVCGVRLFYHSERWRLQPCDFRLPFVCYSIPSERRVKRVVKLRIKSDSSLDLNDPAVKADILKKLQDKLKTKAEGVSLKWKEQPDGKVFHQEGKSSKMKQREKTEL